MPWRRRTDVSTRQGPQGRLRAADACEKLELDYWMRLTRTLEEQLVAPYRQTKVVGGIFRSLGQEADAVGSAYALEPRDVLSHEDTRTGCLAGEIRACITERRFAWLDAPVMRITAHDVARPYVPPLEDYVLPQTSAIVRGARWVLNY